MSDIILTIRNIRDELAAIVIADALNELMRTAVMEGLVDDSKDDAWDYTTGPALLAAAEALLGEYDCDSCPLELQRNLRAAIALAKGEDT